MLDWDPLQMSPTDLAQITPQCSFRLKRDVKNLMDEPLEGVLIEPDEGDFLKVHALITGAPGTPYEKGFFYFLIGFPSNYPFAPPKVRFMTTAGGKVRFNPNLYSNGKVCSSILNTFPGPEWSSCQGLRSVLLALQSILNEKPYCNEPGYETEKRPGDIALYSQMIKYETVRVAAIGTVLNDTKITMPQTFINHIEEVFLECYDYFEDYIINNITLTNTPIEDPLYNYKKGTYQYDILLNHLESAKAAILSKKTNPK